MPFVYGILPLSLVIGLHLFFVINIQIGTQSSTSYTSQTSQTREEFEGQWTQVMEKCDMLTNKHVIDLYQIKHFWVSCYLRGHFLGRMIATGRSESINAFIKMVCQFSHKLDPTH